MAGRYATAAVGAATRLFYPAEQAAYPDAFRAFASAPAADAPVLEFDDVILANGRDWACLYDREGRRIDATALVRYDANGAPQFWRAAPQLPSTKTYLTIAEPVVYQSILFNHWGHFLLESIARLAGKLERPDLADLPSIFTWQSPRPLPAIDAFLAAAGQTLRPYEASGARVRLAKCFAPAATFAHEGYADPRHLEAPHRVARRLLTSGARDERPVYFSRARLAQSASGRGGVANEAEFEARLAEHGVRIVHMQELGLAEQIGVVNAHRQFLGLWGSALHNLMFSLRGPEVESFVLIDEGRLPANFLLVDALVGNAAHYLATLRPAEDGRLRIDVEPTLAYLKDCGAV